MDAPGVTARLCLRNWKESDKIPFRLMNADPRVMKYSVTTLSEAESDEEACSITAHQKAHNFSLWAVELQVIASFIGYVGLFTSPAPFLPGIEIGWRLAYDYWGYGYATEAAQATLKFGFEMLNLNEIVAFTAQINLRSQRLMQRLGMQHSIEEDFRHPFIPREHILSQYVLYRLSREHWKSSNTIASDADCTYFTGLPLRSSK